MRGWRGEEVGEAWRLRVWEREEGELVGCGGVYGKCEKDGASLFEMLLNMFWFCVFSSVVGVILGLGLVEKDGVWGELEEQ